MATKEQAFEVAKSLNQVLFMEKHLRFDVATGSQEQGRQGKVRKPDAVARIGVEDFNTTVFVGNLPFIVSEEDVRAHFAPLGKILNVRMVRDPKTYVGKGVGYIQYETKE